MRAELKQVLTIRWRGFVQVLPLDSSAFADSRFPQTYLDFPLEPSSPVMGGVDHERSKGERHET